MRKPFCDNCGDEITAGNKFENYTEVERASSLGHGLPKSKMKVMLTVSKDDQDCAGDYCNYCVVKAVNQLDDRTL